MSRLHKLFSAVVVCVVLVTLSACSSINLEGFDFDSFLKPTSYEEAFNAAATSTLPTVTTPTILEEGVLTVGIKTNASVPLFIQGEGNAIYGIDVDLASAIAKELGLAVRFVSISDVSLALGTTCDIAMDVASGEESSATVVGSYSETCASFFHKGESRVLSASELEGKTVALQEGSVSQQMLQSTTLVVTERSFSSLNEAFDALDAGLCDYVLCEAYPGAYLASLYTDVHLAGTIEVPSSVGIAVATDNPTLQTSVQAALDVVSTNGVFEIIRSKWIGGMPQLSSSDVIAGIELAPEPSTNTDSVVTESDVQLDSETQEDVSS